MLVFLLFGALAAGPPQIPVPPLAQIIARLLENGYPRIFLTRRNLERWRAAIRGPRSAGWKAFAASLDQAAAVNAADPPPFTGERRASAANNRVFQKAVGRAERVEEAIRSPALSCLLTGNAEHGRAARSLLLALASWDPQAATSRKNNDRAFRGVVRGLSLGYDWLNGAGALSEAHRRQVERVIAVRAEQYVEWYRQAQVSTRWPSTSHANGGVPYFGEMATAFAGALPETEEWLRCFVYVVTANYSGFGRADGSWPEGGRYWHNTIGRHLFPLWGVCASLGLNMWAHPFFVNGGYFKIYSNPPWDTMTPFGDGHNQAVGPIDGNVVGIIGQYLRNPEYAWYGVAARRGEKPQAPRSAGEFLTSDENLPEKLASAAEVRRLPLARLFPDTGLAALRTSLADRAAPLRDSFLVEHFMEKFVPDVPDWQAVGNSGWKYIHYPTLQNMDELYDLTADPHEIHNVIAKPGYAEPLGRLKAGLARHLRETDDPRLRLGFL